TFTDAGWDFEEVWQMQLPAQGLISYPYLRALEYDEPFADPAVNPIPGLVALFAGGNGTAESPFEIENWFHLDNVRLSLSSHFLLTQNLGPETEGYTALVMDADGDLANDGKGWEPLTGACINFDENYDGGFCFEYEYFSGSFDGNGKGISGLFINRPDDIDVGLFSRIRGGHIKNVGLFNAMVTGIQFTGILVGRVGPAGSPFSGDYSPALIEAVFVNGSVTGTADVGGVVGTIGWSDVRQIHADVTVQAQFGRAGGILGNMTKSHLFDSFSDGSVTANGNSVDASAGGLVGTVIDSFPSEPRDTIIMRSYSTAEISSASSSRGGLIGFVRTSVDGTNPGVFANNFWDVEASGQNSSPGGTGLNTSQMKTKSTFTDAGWDFEEVWQIQVPAQGFISYPYLRALEYDEPFAEPAVNPIPGLDYFAAELVITGTEGWRFIASPVMDASYAELFSTIWTQGMEGANDPRTNVSPNVLQLNADGEYVRVENLNNSFDPGLGAVVYVFADSDPTDDDADKSFPKILSVSGSEATGDIAVSNLNYGSAEQFSLIGNPFNSGLSFSCIPGTNRNNIAEVVFVYDSAFTGTFEGEGRTNANAGIKSEDEGGGHAGGGFRAWNGSVGSLTGGVIAPFQSFLVYTLHDGEANLTIPEHCSNRTGATFFRETPSEPVPAIQIAARINEQQESDLWLSFTPSGSLLRNESDALSLYPLDFRSFLSVFVWNDDRALDIKNLPADLTEKAELPVFVEAWEAAGTAYQPMSGTVELIWPVFENIPDDWDVTITDLVTGHSTDLREVERYVFELDASRNKNDALEHKVAIRSFDAAQKNGTEARLMITIDPGNATHIPDEGLPSVFTLQQNYPNPFNPTTTIRYALPETAEVRLEVYNVLGQRVAVLVNGTQQAGWHTASFDASRLSSGLYLYRLQAGSYVETRSMILVK
ncbi:MAG: T9SS type A sorting domain-containing protein, partial [Candidatus Cyclonatronum sp.]|uniref:T9SS type A sorting domain-containing protein n=1 Tax=Cyclonatronum sp. TaxID=3024185 RepID=UPI0025BAFF37